MYEGFIHAAALNMLLFLNIFPFVRVESRYLLLFNRCFCPYTVFMVRGRTGGFVGPTAEIFVYQVKAWLTYLLLSLGSRLTHHQRMNDIV